jgi:hypothetical protein
MSAPELTAAEPCPQAWHGGLPAGLLRDCKYVAGHRGAHRDLSGDLSWSGKLTDEELALAEKIRTAPLAVVTAAQEGDGR